MRWQSAVAGALLLCRVALGALAEDVQLTPDIARGLISEDVEIECAAAARTSMLGLARIMPFSAAALCQRAWLPHQDARHAGES